MPVEYRDPIGRQAVVRSHSRRPSRGRGPSWKFAAGRRTPSSSSASTNCCPPQIELVHGPGCPVCVTPLELIDRAIAIAAQPGVIFCSFGDMCAVPEVRRDLFAVKAAGGDVRIVYSPLDCLRIAPAESPAHGGLLRRGLRDHRAGQRHGRLAGQTPRARRTSPYWSRT